MSLREMYALAVRMERQVQAGGIAEFWATAAVTLARAHS